jgi:hypothetical protein
MAGLSEERHELRAAAVAIHEAALKVAREQFAAEKDAIDRAFDLAFDAARDAGFVTLDEIHRLRDRPRPSYAEIVAKRDAAIAVADMVLDKEIGRIFDKRGGI